MYPFTRTRISRAVPLALTCLAASSVARAQLLDPLLPAGSFTLSPAFDLFPTSDNYATPGFPGDDLGPLGVTFLSGPFRVMVTDWSGEIYVYGVDTPMGGPAQPPVANPVTYLPGNAVGLAPLGGAVYMTQQTAGKVVTVSSAPGAEGTLLSTVATLTGATGIVAFPPLATVPGVPSHVGHLFVSAAGGVFEVDPAIGGGYTPPVYITTGMDGMAITPSGNYLLGAAGSGITVWDISAFPPVLVYTLAVPMTPSVYANTDGIAIGTGKLAGKAYVNCNNGELWEVVYDMAPGFGPELDPPTPGIATRIVYAGSRGDFIAVDGNVACPPAVGSIFPYASLLFTQSSSIWRLDPQGGGWFGPPSCDQNTDAPFGEAWSYCTAGTTTNGCVASMSSAGVPSASAANGFTLTCSNIEGQKQALMFYGASGPAAIPWGSGSASFLCVKAPTQRLGATNTGGNAGLCNGSVSIDWSAYMAFHPSALGNPLMAGQMFHAQTWFRDPPAPKTTNLSDGLQWVTAP